MTVLDRFEPGRDDARLAWCCGAYRRWERVVRGGRVWWQLASDWGQATVRGLVVPPGDFHLAVELDLTELPSGALYVALVPDLRVGSMGVDGLQFFGEAVVTVGVEQRAVRCSLTPTASTVHALDGERLSRAPTSLGLAVQDAALQVTLDGVEFARVDRPCLEGCAILLGGNTGSDDPKGRFGLITLTVESSAQR